MNRYSFPLAAEQAQRAIEHTFKSWMQNNPTKKFSTKQQGKLIAWMAVIFCMLRGVRVRGDLGGDDFEEIHEGRF